MPTSFTSETSTSRHILSKYCRGIGMDIGFGGDKITSSAWAFDMPAAYTKTGADKQQMRGSCQHLEFLCDEALDYIYSSHLLEDFYYEEILDILIEWRRVLRQGGFLVINCPDQKAFLTHCSLTRQPVNLAHKERDFSLENFVVRCLKRAGQWNIVYQNPSHGPYSFLLVAEKTGSATQDDQRQSALALQRCEQLSRYRTQSGEICQTPDHGLHSLLATKDSLQRRLKDALDAQDLLKEEIEKEVARGTLAIQHRVDSLLASRSWRITAPIRYLTTIFRRTHGAGRGMPAQSSGTGDTHAANSYEHFPQSGAVQDSTDNYVRPTSAFPAQTDSALLGAFNRHPEATTQQIATLASLELVGEDGNARLYQQNLFAPWRGSILVLKLDHLGDFLLSLPACNKLRKRFPHARIDIVIGPWNKQVAEKVGIFDRVITADYIRRDLTSILSPQEIGERIAHLGFYDLAIDLRTQPETRWLLPLVGAKLRAGFKSGHEQVDKYLDVALLQGKSTNFYASARNRTHQSLQMIHLVDSLPYDYRDYINLAELAAIRTGSRDKKEIGIFPEAGVETREWPTENWAMLLRLLAAEQDIHGINLYLSSQAGEARYSLPHSPKVKVHRNIELSHLLELLTLNSVCLANNSGGAHLSGFLGVPCLAIFGGVETPEEWAPIYGHSFVVTRKAPCEPCHLARRSECPHSFICLNDITPATVHKFLLRILDRHRTEET